MMPLLYATPDTELIVTRISGGRHLIARLAAMGITPGKEIRVMHASRFDSTVIGLGNCRYAVGRGVAMRIFVRPKDNLQI